MFRILRWLTSVVLLIVVLGAVAADFGAKRVAETAMADRAKQSTGASSASASIGGFPFLYDVLGRGSVDTVDLTLEEVPAGTSLTLQSVHVHLVKVAIDRQELIHKRKVTIQSIASGTAAVTISAPELTAAAGRTITLTSSGQILVDVGGQRAQASATMGAADVLDIDVSGVTVVSLDLARNPIVPACSFSLTVTGSAITATCTMTPVPPAVIAAMSS
ncbi:MAG: LmeA family phospholipid-binding protein [Acidimicrobiales bacterium]